MKSTGGLLDRDERRATHGNDYRHIVPFTDEPTRTASVVIPTHGNARSLELCFRALDSQRYPRDLWEVVVVEDGCDGVARSLRRSWGFPLTVVSLGEGSNRRATARNAGIEAASGEVIVSLDADIMLPAHGLDAHLGWFHTGERVATIGVRRFVDISGEVADLAEAWALPDIVSRSNTAGRSIDTRIPDVFDLHSHPLPAQMFHGGNVAYTKADAESVGMWAAAFDGNSGYEDLDFGHRLWQSGVYLIFEPTATVLHIEGEISLPARRDEAARNRELLYQRHPEFRAFREGTARAPELVAGRV